MATRAPWTLLVVGAAVAAGCRGYRPAPVDIDRPLRAPAPAQTSPAFEEAVRLAVERNPDLLALRARISAVNLRPPLEPVEVGAGVDSDHRPEATASLDALSLLGLGPRRAERALAAARREEARLAHHERAREIAAEIAETFAVERALATLGDVDVEVDAETYVRAGLEAPVAEGLAEATRVDWRAEASRRAAERDANRIFLERLLGLPPGTGVVPAAVPEGWPEVPEPTPEALIRTRADVQRDVAAFEVADRELRLAVKRQYPSVILEPGLAADPTTLFGAVRLRIPVGAGTEVVALESAREAARMDVESAVLDALREARESRVLLAAAVAAREAAERRLKAATDLLRVGRTRLQVETGSVTELVLTADAVVDAARALREAVVEEARARVHAARDAGWPSPQP